MAKIYTVLLFLMFFCLVIFGNPQTATAQPKPTPESSVKAKECDDDEEITEADRASVKISVKDAKLIALGRVPGKVMDAEFEKERGRLQYAFDILGTDGKTYDVEIDAITGEVLQAELEDDDDDDGPVTKAVVTKKIVERRIIAVKKPE
jgi:uncharacterized membrane protein YkoI